MMTFMLYIIILMAAFFEKDDIENIREERVTSQKIFSYQCTHASWKNTFRLKITRDFLGHVRLMLQNTKQCWWRKLLYLSDIPRDSYCLSMPSVTRWIKFHENKSDFRLKTVFKSLTNLGNTQIYWANSLYLYNQFNYCVFASSAFLLDVPFQKSYNWEMKSSFSEEETSFSCSLETPMLWFQTRMTYIKKWLSLLTDLRKRDVFHDTNLYKVPSLWGMDFGSKNKNKKTVFFICDNHPQYSMILYPECKLNAWNLKCFSSIKDNTLFIKKDMFHKFEFKEWSYPRKWVHCTSFYLEYVMHTISWNFNERHSDDLCVTRCGINLNEKYLNEMPISDFLTIVHDTDYFHKRLTFESYGHLNDSQSSVKYIWPVSSTLESNYLLRRNQQQMQHEISSTVALYQNVNANNFLSEFFQHLNLSCDVDIRLKTKQRTCPIENATHGYEKTMKGNEELHFKNNLTSSWFDTCNLAGRVFKYISAIFVGVGNAVLLVMYQHFRKHTLDNFDDQPSTASWNFDGKSKNDKTDNNFQENKQCYTLNIHLQLDTHHAVFVIEVLFVHVVLLGFFAKPIYQKLILISNDRPNLKSTSWILSRLKIFIGNQNKFEAPNAVTNRVCFVPETCRKSEDTIVCESTNSFNILLATNKSTQDLTKAQVTSTFKDIEHTSIEHQERPGLFPNVIASFDKPNATAFLEDEDNQQTFVKSLEDDITDVQQGVTDMDIDESNFNILSRAVNGHFNERDDIFLNSEQNKRNIDSICSLCSKKCENTVTTAYTANQNSSSFIDKNVSDASYCKSFTDSFPKDCDNSFSFKSYLSTTYDKESLLSDNDTSLYTFPTCCASVHVYTFHDENESKINPVKKTNPTDKPVKIVTSVSKYTDSTFRAKKDGHHNRRIDHSVKKFFLSRERRRRRRNNRRILRELRQCVNILSFLEPDITICNPLHTDRSSCFLVQDEGNRSEFVSERNQSQRNNRDTSIDDSEQGNLSSIFNSFSIDSLHEEHRYTSEWIRLASFANFDSQSVHAIRLARNGWYSTGNRDQTTCFSCHEMHENWTRDENPDDFHDTECRFLQNASNNISIPRSLPAPREHESTLERNRTLDIATDQDATDISPLYAGIPAAERSRGSSEYQTSEILESTNASSTESARQLKALKKNPMGINFDRPKYPSYAILSVRLSSFSDWPSDKTQTPRDLALAGFFYAGYGDYTRCFFCGGGLRNWEDGDDPWVEHARWFSQCAFVRQNKGQEFIDLVQQRAQELERQQRGEFKSDLSENEKPKDEKVMNSEAVLAIKRMGYTEDTIRTAINTLKSRLSKGKHKVSSHEIIEVILEIESKTKPKETQQEMMSTAQAVGGKTTTADLMPEALGNEGFSDQITCQICLEKKVSIAFLPCSHLVCCEDCAPAMRTCPFCRKFIQGTVKTFLV